MQMDLRDRGLWDAVDPKGKCKISESEEFTGKTKKSLKSKDEEAVTKIVMHLGKKPLKASTAFAWSKLRETYMGSAK